MTVLPPSVDQGLYNQGLEILRAFHDRASQYGFNLSFSELLLVYGKRTPFMLEGLGGSLSDFGITMADAKFYMTQLADNLKGKFPEYWLGYYDSIKNAQINPGFWKTLSAVNASTGRDIIKITGSERLAHGFDEFVLSDVPAFLNRMKLPSLLIGGGIIVLGLVYLSGFIPKPRKN